MQTIHRRSEPADGPWRPDERDGRVFVELVDKLGFDSIWCGDHVAFAIPILDPIVQLAQAATYSDRLAVGTCVYLLPLRHPGPVAKQIATLDLLSGGRLIFGVGVGGEFQSDFDVSGIPIDERGVRLTESIEMLRALWRGDSTTYLGQGLDPGQKTKPIHAEMDCVHRVRQRRHRNRGGKGFRAAGTTDIISHGVVLPFGFAAPGA